MENDRERVFDCTTSEFKVSRGNLQHVCCTIAVLAGIPPVGQPMNLVCAVNSVQGMVSVVDPKSSWCAKWLHLK